MACWVGPIPALAAFLPAGCLPACAGRDGYAHPPVAAVAPAAAAQSHTGQAQAKISLVQRTLPVLIAPSDIGNVEVFGGRSLFTGYDATLGHEPIQLTGRRRGVAIRWSGLSNVGGWSGAFLLSGVFRDGRLS